MKLEFFRQILEKSQISNFIKTRPVGAELSKRTDRQDETISLSPQFCERA